MHQLATYIVPAAVLAFCTGLSYCTRRPFRQDAALQNGPLDIGTSFGGHLTTRYVGEKLSFQGTPDFALCCKTVSSNASTPADIQFISYEETDFPLAIGLCTWLSYRFENFDKIALFRLQCLQQDRDKRELEKFKHDLLSALSPGCVLEASGERHVGALQTNWTRKLLEFSASLKQKGDKLRAERLAPQCFDCYHSASMALSGWQARFRQSKPIWARLLFDITADKLGLHLDTRTEISTWELFDKSLNWACNDDTDNTGQRLIPKENAARYLHLYAQAIENEGRINEAFLWSRYGVRLSPTNQSLRENTKRLFSSVDRRILEPMSAFPRLFGIPDSIDVRRHTYSDQNIPGHEQRSHQPDCPICLECFGNAESISLTKQCKHQFHAKCLDKWLNLGQQSCPTCRESIL